jgi:hypothetical protein
MDVAKIKMDRNEVILSYNEVCSVGDSLQNFKSITESVGILLRVACRGRHKPAPSYPGDSQNLKKPTKW